MVRADPDGLDLAAPGTQATKGGDEDQVQRSHDLLFEYCNSQELVRVGLNGVECGEIAGVERQAWVLALPTQHIVGQEGYYGGKVVSARASEGHLGHRDDTASNQF